jgi:hypothetical protein
MKSILRCAPLAAALLTSALAHAQDWYPESPTTSPAARRFHAMFAMGRDVFLFGGVDERTGTTFGDTWRYDGQQWHRVHGRSPGARSRAALCANAAEDRAILFGGRDADGNALGDAWSFDGKQWQPLVATGAPAARFGAAMAFDQPNGRFVLFGGVGANGALRADTHELDGTTWHARSGGAAPSPRLGHAMVFDSVHSRTLLFGGFTGSSDPANAETWAWDGASWQQLSTAHVPPPMVFPAMVWHATHGVAVLTGSVGGAAHAMATRVFDGSDWIDGPVPHGIAARQGHALAFDAIREAVVLFGGATVGLGAVPRGDTWELSTQARLQFLGSACGATAPMLAALGDATPRLGTDLTMVMSPVRTVPMLLAAYGMLPPASLPPGCAPSIDAHIAQPMVRMGSVATLALSIPANRVLLGTTLLLQGVELRAGAAEPSVTPVAELRFGN